MGDTIQRLMSLVELTGQSASFTKEDIQSLLNTVVSEDKAIDIILSGNTDWQVFHDEKLAKEMQQELDSLKAGTPQKVVDALEMKTAEWCQLRSMFSTEDRLVEGKRVQDFVDDEEIHFVLNAFGQNTRAAAKHLLEFHRERFTRIFSDEAFAKEMQRRFDTLTPDSESEHSADVQEIAFNILSSRPKKNRAKARHKSAGWCELRDMFTSPDEIGAVGGLREQEFISDAEISFALDAFDEDLSAAAAYLREVSESRLENSHRQASRYRNETAGNRVTRDVFLAEVRALGGHASRNYLSAKSAPSSTPQTSIGETAIKNVDYELSEKAKRHMYSLEMNKQSGLHIDTDDGSLSFRGFRENPIPAKRFFDGESISQVSTVYRIDLHGVEVREALQLVRSVVRSMRASDSPQVRGGAAVGLQVGKGSHSVKGVSKLMPSITADLKRLGVSFVTTVTWIILRTQRCGAQN